MESIKKYVNNFFKRNKGNLKYQIYTGEIRSCAEAVKVNPLDTIITLFNYGYAKGYRAAMAEMKKGGAA